MLAGEALAHQLRITPLVRSSTTWATQTNQLQLTPPSLLPAAGCVLLWQPQPLQSPVCPAPLGLRSLLSLSLLWGSGCFVSFLPFIVNCLSLPNRLLYEFPLFILM